jgi:DNA (cytosine-5)-methyltransferase 1
MKYGSVCSGIEAASVAWHDLGWEPQWFSEIEQFPSEVLKHRFPDVPNLGDMTQLTQNPTFNERSIDLLVGGTPCQSFSVAGLRKGLADPRGNLMLTFLALADAKKPKWIVWENVPGVLSSNGGRDFGTFLGALGELGYGFAFRTLNAEYFGVPQRRRRVFVVGYLGDWRVAAAVLFERESLQGNIKPSRKKREEVAANAEGSVGEAGDVSCVGGNISPTVTSKWMKGYGGPSGSNETGNMVYATTIIDRAAFNQGENAQYEPRIETGETMSSLVARGPHAVAQPIGINGNIAGTIDANYFKGCGSANFGERDVVAQPIAVDTYNYTTNNHTTQTIRSQSDTEHIGAVMHSMAIRRLTPKECERLQGFPDDWTKIPYRNKPADQCPDGPRYKACGNSMAVPVMRWIGQRIQYVENLMKEL